MYVRRAARLARVRLDFFALGADIFGVLGPDFFPLCLSTDELHRFTSVLCV